jgi:putative NIF3 family GTP cyclohydrolase 1 type 2
MHTNLDNARGGVNYKIAERLGLQNVRFLAGKTIGQTECGSGVTGCLPSPVSSLDFVRLVKRQLEAESAMCNQLLSRPIQKVAICGGAGDFLLSEALHAGADAFLTGEMHYHQYFGYEQQLQICVIGHYESEHFTAQLFQEIMAKACPEVRTVVAETNTNPIHYL